MKLWLADLTHTQQILNSDIMPAAIGSIAAYTEQELGIRARLFKYPEKLAAALETEVPDVIGFSNYIWNFRLSYAFTERIKQIASSTTVVFGGPNFPIETQGQVAWFSQYQLIDFYVEHEAELAFVDLLRNVAGNTYDDTLKRIWHRSDRADLSKLPSPYLSGFMDEFFDGKLIPILQTNRGCPFTCTFCVEGMPYYTKVNRRPREVIDAEIDYIGAKISEIGGRKDVYIADSNFGMYKEDIDTCKAIARSMEEHDWPEYINTTTGKNAKARVLEAAKLVKGALRLSGSVQSLDKEVLYHIKRANIREDEILDLAMKAAELGANSYSEIILGLPGDSREKHLRSLRTIVEAGFQNVYTWQLMLLPGSELDTTTERQRFGLKTVFRILPRCFGQFEVRGEMITAAEIEEVCISSDTLSFEDYLYCRKLHLTIAIFYNDALMNPFLKLLRLRQLSVFDWLLEISGKTHALFAEFTMDTREELFADKEKLARFAHERIADYIGGHMGNNLVFTYRVRALRHYLLDMVRIGAEALRHMVPEDQRFIDQAANYILHRSATLFDEPDQTPVTSFVFDLPAFDAERQPTHLYPIPMEKQYRFEPSTWFKNQLAIYGNTEVGISRMLMKTNVSKLYREAVAV